MTFLIFLLIFYLIACFFAYGFQEKLIFFPTSLSLHEQEELRLKFPNTEIAFKSPDGVNLHGWLIKGDDPKNKSFIIYYGGNAEEVSGHLFSKPLGNISSLYMNYRGYGLSEGRPSEKNLLKDALFIFDEMVRRGEIIPEQTYLMGRSLGSAVAVYVASERRVKGVILISPFDSLINLAKRHYPFLPVSLILKQPFDSLNRAEQMNTPLLMITAEKDTIVPPEHSLRLFEKWKGEKTHLIIQTRDHNDLNISPEYEKTIKKFIGGFPPSSE